MNKLSLSEKLNTIRSIHSDEIDRIQNLQIALLSDTLDSESRVNYEQMLKKEMEGFVNSVHSTSIWFRESRSLWCTKIKYDGKFKTITAKSKEELIQKLYLFYTGEGQSTVMQDLYPKMLNYKKLSVTEKTLKEYAHLWKKYVQPSRAASWDLKKIPFKVWRIFFTGLIVDNHMSRKSFKDLLTVFNAIAKYALSCGLIDHNIFADIAQVEFPFAPEQTCSTVKAKAFSAEQEERIVDWCHLQLDKPRVNALYPLTILFNRKMGLRFAELRGLRWENVDFDNNTIIVSEQNVQQYELTESGTFEYRGRENVDHIKSYEDARVLPLSEEGKDILTRIKALKYSEEYVFPLRYHTYNDKIKAAAKYAGITDMRQIRTHSLRTTAATAAYRKCHDIKTVQALLGHTTAQMTDKYIKNLDSLERLRAIM